MRKGKSGDIYDDDKTRIELPAYWVITLISLLFILFAMIINLYWVGTPDMLKSNFWITISNLAIEFAGGLIGSSFLYFLLNRYFGIGEVKVSSIESEIKNLTDDTLRNIGSLIHKESMSSINELQSPAKYFGSEGEYLGFLGSELDKLQSMDNFRAVCGKKAWGAQWVSNYMAKNHEAVKRKVEVSRFFLEDEKFQKEVMQQMDKQYNYGVVVKKIFEKDLKKYTTWRNFPVGFGFAIVNNKFVVIHFGVAELEGMLYTSNHVVGLFNKIYNELESISNDHQPSLL